MHNKDILAKVGDYYSAKIREHGPSPAGVDWNSAASQELRFDQLLKVLPADPGNFSVLDYGCGFGSMYAYLKDRYTGLSFTGFDISEDMIRTAAELNPAGPAVTWTDKLPAGQKYDYLFASGIFNVKQEVTEDKWKAYILQTLGEMDALAVKGFAFNCLTSYSDKDRMREDLCYADPAWLFDHCKRHFSRAVALLHDYPLYEFTILVKKME